MKPIVERCAGLDVHQASVTATIRVIEGNQVRQETRTFSTVTSALRHMAEWFQRERIERVAMEATGVYWHPVWNVLEGGFHLLLVNPAHMKKVPGRKTDVKDAEWIAQLLQYGLLQGSFVPPTMMRDLRDLTRLRTKLEQHQTAIVNRIHKALQGANIKLASTISDIMGKSGRAMLDAIVAGETRPEVLASLAHQRMCGKIPMLRLALDGHIREHHRFMLGRLLNQYDSIEAEIRLLSERVEELMLPFADLIQALDAIPGLAQRLAENILSEIGLDMSQFPSAGHLTVWGGVCPGRNQSAGKNRSGRTAKANAHLTAYLVEAAWAAGRTRGTYLSAVYSRVARRRGKKRAAVAVGRHILIAAYFIIRDGCGYRDLGADHFKPDNPEAQAKLLAAKIRALGFDVTLTPREDTDTAA